MSTAERIRKAALGPKWTDDLTALFGYHTAPWVLVKARLPESLPMLHWIMAREEVRRMFLLFVAEALEQK